MELYHPVRIGKLALDGNIFLAPVAGYTDKAFRSICVEAGANFSYTELVSAEALVRGSDASEAMLQAAFCEKKYAVQLFGSSPESMARAVKIVLEKSTCSCIDINCGCPVPKVVKTGAGAALTRDAERLYDVAKAAVDAAGEFAEASASGNHSATVGTSASGAGVANASTDASESAFSAPVPVTVKIRSGWDANHITWKEAADAAISAGVSAITLHPRTRAQGYEGKADWNCLKELVAFVRGKSAAGASARVEAAASGAGEARAAADEPATANESAFANGRVAVFGSGDLFTPEDARAMLTETGCDGVMFARGAMGNPFIFSQTRSFLTTGVYEQPDADVRIKTGLRELELLTAERGEARACREMRKRFCSYTKGIEGGARLRAEIVHAETIADYERIFLFVKLCKIN